MRLSSLVRGVSSAEGTIIVKEGRSVRRRILVIDHNDNQRLMVCDRLHAMGFDVVGEDNGVSGLSCLAYEMERIPFSGMLLELQMPVLGGLAVLQEMRDRYPQIPVIVMSGAEHIERLREAVKLGAREYLVKPFDGELLRRKCVRVFLGKDHPS